MSGPAATRHNKKTQRRWLSKWFGANRGTHWTIAGAVAVIILGTYLIYNTRDGNPAAATTITTAGQTPVPMTSAPSH
jgi:hypothetical protein